MNEPETAWVYPAWDGEPWSWRPGMPDKCGVIGPYLVSILECLWQEGLAQRFQIYICWGNVKKIKQEASKPKIVFHRGDERGSDYGYPDVTCVFREYFRKVSPPSVFNPSALPGQIIEFAQDVAAHCARYVCRVKRVYALPIGFSNAIDLPLKSMAERTWDVSFGGSINHRPKEGIKQFVSLKSQSRRSMSRQLEAIKRDARLRVCDWSTAGFGTTDASLLQKYKEVMASSCVALVPRGTSRETFRHFEAAQAGCAIITDSVPNTWYFQNHPFIMVKNWSEICNIIPEIVGSRRRLEDLSLASLQWWSNCVSPTSIAEYVARLVNDVHD